MLSPLCGVLDRLIGAGDELAACRSAYKRSMLSGDMEAGGGEVVAAGGKGDNGLAGLMGTALLLGGGMSIIGTGKAGAGTDITSDGEKWMGSGMVMGGG